MWTSLSRAGVGFVFVLTAHASFGADLIADHFAKPSHSAWRYADAQGRWEKPTAQEVIAAGKPTPAAVLELDVRGATLIFLAYHYRILEVGGDLRLRVRYRFNGPQASKAKLVLRLTSLPKGERDPRGGGKSRGEHVVEPLAEIDGWQTIDTPVTRLGLPVGHGLYRVHITGRAPEGCRGLRLCVRDIALHDGTGAAASAAAPVRAPSTPGTITGEKIRAVYPKTLWHTDSKCRFSEDALRWLHSSGFNYVGPARGDEAALRMLGERARRIGLRIYGSRAVCYKRRNGEQQWKSLMVWFNGTEQDIACPASDEFWKEALVEPCTLYARVSREVPLVAALIDWEIYARPKFRGVYGPCYCARCLARYRERTGSKIPDLPPAERCRWLRKQGEMAQYDNAFYQRIVELARGLRKAIDKENPKLSIFLIPWSSPFLEAVARGVATKQAPVWVSNESTYGKASPSIPDDAAIAANVNTCLADRRRLDELGIPYRYLAATYNGWGSPEFHGRALIRMAQVSHGYWFFEDVGWYRKTEGRIDRSDLYRCYAHANAEIRFGTYDDPWRWGERTHERLAPQVPEGKIGVGLSGDSGGRLAALLDPERYFTYAAPSLDIDSLGQTRVLVLQNFNARLDANSPVVRCLRELVLRGGGLFLGHDTGYFMASPFPKIVRGPSIPPEKGDSRHILDLKIQIQSDAQLLGDLAGQSFETSFNDHLVFEVGPKGIVLARDRYGYLVMVAGQAGKGRVVYSGCWYGRLADTTCTEARVTRGLLAWLAGVQAAGDR